MENLNQLMSYVIGGLAFLLVLTILVAVHELGHFWVAKACGMKVVSFAVMIGGRRVTDLTSRLERPLASAWLPWGATVIALIALVASSMLKLDGVYIPALFLLGIVIPGWVALRLGTLYHLDIASSLKGLGMCWIGGFAIMLLSRKSGIDVKQILTVLSLASGLGLLLLYYLPVLKKGESDTMGQGMIEVEGEEVEVRFRPLASRMSKGGTEFSLLLVPAGGFAQIKGMEPKPDGSEASIEGGFYSRPPLQRLAVLFAGPFFSIAFGILILVALFTTVGENQPINKPILGFISKDSPAEKAGLKVNDEIISVNGEKTNTFYDIIRIVRDRGDMKTEIVLKRKNQILTVFATPEKDRDKTPVFDENLEIGEKRAVQGKLGIRWSDHYVVIGVGEAAAKSIAMPFKMVASLASVAKDPGRAKSEVAGPGTLAVTAVAAAQEGITTVCLLAALLSISLGVMNLLPFPPLDGGQMVVAFIELLRGGRRLSLQVQEWVFRGGFLLVLAMMVATFAIDVNRFIGKEEKPTVSSSRDGGTNPPTEEGKKK